MKESVIRNIRSPFSLLKTNVFWESILLVKSHIMSNYEK